MVKILNNIISSKECSFLPTQVYFGFGIIKCTVDANSISLLFKWPPVPIHYWEISESLATMVLLLWLINWKVFNLHLKFCQDINQKIEFCYREICMLKKETFKVYSSSSKHRWTYFNWNILFSTVGSGGEGKPHPLSIHILLTNIDLPHSAYLASPK